MYFAHYACDIKLFAMLHKASKEVPRCSDDFACPTALFL